jgi:hypothetical protein
MISLQRVCLTRDRKTAVPENDPRAAWLLIGKGGEIPDKEMAKYKGAKELCGKTADEVSGSGSGSGESDGLDDLNKADLLTLAGAEHVDLLTAKTKPEILARVRAHRKEKAHH